MKTTPTAKDGVISLQLPGDRGVVVLERCEDTFFQKACAFGVPIGLHQGPWICTTMVTEEMGLPQFYAALTSLTGPTGALYDSYKGAFSFPFKMTVRRADETFKYLLHILNFRSMVEPLLYRLNKETPPAALRAYHAPFDDELTMDEIAYVLRFFLGYLSGYSRTMPKWTTPFLAEVESNGILFGYDPQSGEFFEKHYDTTKDYEKALAQWRKVIPEDSGWDFAEANWGS